MDKIVTVAGTVRPVASANGPDTPSDYPQQLPVVDIAIKNSGSKPVEITAIRAESVYFRELPDCGGFGGGPAQLTASYSLVFPTIGATTNDKKLASTIVTVPTEFTIQSDSIGRLETTFGPDKQSVSFVKPNIIAVKIILITDSNEELTVGTAGGVTTARNIEHMKIYESEFAGKNKCNSENLEALMEMASLTDVTSPLVEEITAIYRRNT